MWARTIPWQALRAIQDMGIMTINICMDDRHSFRGKKYNGQWMGTAGLIPGLDLALTAAPEIVLWYAVEGIPALFWPEASNPDFFHPMNIQKKHDVCFVGANYGIRTKIVSTLKKKGIQVTCFGEGWPNGRISTKTIPELFASSRIILGVGTIGYCEDFYSLKMRDFDAPMSGSLYITHNNPDLARVYEVGKEIVTYKTIDECVEKVNFYLNQPEQANRIAEAGYKRAMKDHTWKCRFEKLFQAVGLI
jgi:spore maturation protein CgeB